MTTILPQSSWSSKLLQFTVALTPSLVTNQINTFTTAAGAPAQGVYNTVTFPFLRSSARITNSGTVAGTTGHFRIWGLTLSQMYQLATLGISYNILPYNFLTVLAGDAVSGLTTLFTGTIRNAYGDFEAQPNTPFMLDCVTGAAPGQDAASVGDWLAPTPASFSGTPTIVSMMTGFARQLNYGFTNGGVSTTQTASNPYYSGTVQQQVRKCAEQNGIEVSLNNFQMIIYPKGGMINSIAAPIVSAKTGMIGYPLFMTQGVVVKTLFNPAIVRGGPIQIGSSVLQGTLAAIAKQNVGNPAYVPPVLNGENSVWSVYKLDHALDSQLPDGQWMSTVYCYNPGWSQGVTPPNL